jgi:GT2 family glycosyltransferase
MAESVLCSIIIVYYDGFDKMQKCLNSISDHAPTNVEVVIVNNSHHHHKYALKNRKHIVVGDDRNYGYSKGNNIGLSYAKGQYILLLNPDTELTDRFIEKAITILEKYPNIAAIGPKLTDDYNNVQISAFKFPTIKGYILQDILCLKVNTDKNSPSAKIKNQAFEENIFKCDWLCGAAILFRKDALICVNGFDTRYFLYYEDVDLFNKINKAGYDVAYCPSYIVKHCDKDESGIYSNKFNNARRIVAHDFSLMQYWNKYKPEMIPIVRFLVFVRSLSRLVIWVFSPSLKAHAGSNCVNERIMGYFKSMIMSIIK